MKLRHWDANLKLRLGGEFVTNVIFWTFFPFLAIYFARAFGKGTAGLLLVLSQLAAVFVNLIVGYFTDRYGRKRIMVLAACGQSLGYGLLAAGGLAGLPALSFAGFALASGSISLYQPASQAMVADVVPVKDRASVFAVFYTSVNIAVVVGPLLGSLLYAAQSTILPAAGAIACGLLAALLSRRLRETMPAAAPPAGGPAALQPASWKEALAAQIRGYRIIGSDRVFLLFILAGVLLSQTFMQLDLLLPVYLEEAYPSTPLWSGSAVELAGAQTFGLLVAENGLLVALFTVAVTRWASRKKDRWIFIGGAVCYAAAMALFSQPLGFAGLVAIVALFSFGELLCAGPQQQFVSRLAPERMRGQYFAASSLRFTIGRAVAPLSIPLSGWIGFPWTFGALALLALAAAVIYKIMFDLHEHDGPSPARTLQEGEAL
ncbi:MDR family MFS transporter [Paenibacillus sp. B01]|uniref:MDR family MFS transporter n=1 Tax=Paenibacillus sp. B01 TaxID=2660554 RepID=UPI00129BE653|nr:MFS transporter [Paenibacillus sp. B01]QGG54488.1 MFS transporter [Paenibacillus sp. B01]